ncbi:phospholipase effector Tle1 domain-containing protein [Pseudomonas parafulva]|uniref:phospholipase effector Tle1 domain-containing protein n=1 Tax=Pseudomonas parafulva TaxID=157782 RepID=UPI0004267028|nr:DUF2235 domain-containing protein [Pseudomonas parafulva]
MSDSLHITVYLDGTRNSKDNDAPLGSHTNVARLYDLDAAQGTNLSRNSSHPPLQYDGRERSGLSEKVYIDGVGSQRRNLPAIGFECATGAGGQSRIEQAYQALVSFHNKYPDTSPDVNLVGFSRGAAQARALANVFIERGVPRLDSQGRATGEHLVLPGEANVNKLAIFDTVASYGNPLTAGHTDKNLEIHPNVKSTTHLVAMNEYRATFPLTSALRLDDNTRIEEIRFAGAHSQVGGGYRNDVLAAGPLALMYQRLQAAGVQLEPLLPEDALRVEQYNALIKDPEQVRQALIDSRLSKGNEAFRQQPDGSFQVLDNTSFALERGSLWRRGRQTRPFDHEVSGRKVIYENDDTLSKSPWQQQKEKLAQKIAARSNRAGEGQALVVPVMREQAGAAARREAGFEDEQAKVSAANKAQVEQLSALVARSRPETAFIEQLELVEVPVPAAASRYAVVRINPEGSAAFADLGFEYEVSRILNEAAVGAKARAPLGLDDPILLHDTNGNVVGSLEGAREVPVLKGGDEVVVALDLERVAPGAQADFLHDGLRQASAWVAQRPAASDDAAFQIPGADGKPVGQAYIARGPEREAQLTVAWDAPQP